MERECWRGGGVEMVEIKCGETETPRTRLEDIVNLYIATYQNQWQRRLSQEPDLLSWLVSTFCPCVADTLSRESVKKLPTHSNLSWHHLELNIHFVAHPASYVLIRISPSLRQSVQHPAIELRCIMSGKCDLFCKVIWHQSYHVAVSIGIQ